MSPAKLAATILATLLVLIAVVVSTACSQKPSQQTPQQTPQQTSQRPSQAIVRHSATQCAPANGFGGANEQTLPPAFPRDFPVYPEAIFAAATHPTTTRATVTWTSVVATGEIRAFYEKQLQSGDWQLFGEQYSDPCKAYWHVERRSNTHYGGSLSVYSEPGGGGPAFISADLDRK
jgi:hypothetical protein